MLAKNVPINNISEFTGLKEEEIKALSMKSLRQGSN